MKISNILQCARTAAAFSLAFAFGIAPSITLAQPQSITLVVPAPAGSGPDAIARVIGPQLAKRLNAAVVVDDKPGASGNIGNDIVAKAKPDGATLLTTASNFAVTPAFFKKLPYDPVTDFAPITRLGVSKLVLVTNPSLPAKNLDELVGLVRSKPGAFNYGSSGSGTLLHLVIELIKKRYSLNMVHVPNKATTGAMFDLMAGQTQMMVLPIQTALTQIRAGKLHVIGVVGDTRSPLASDIPSLKEQGLNDMDIAVSFWIAGPAAMSKELVAKLNQEIKVVMAMPEVQAGLTTQGISPETSTPEQQAEAIKKEITYWRKFVAEEKITLD
jgi:tripartite-type tricarboxylate transporter receptor subunit TctC